MGKPSIGDGAGKESYPYCAAIGKGQSKDREPQYRK